MNIYWKRILNFLTGNIPKSAVDIPPEESASGSLSEKEGPDPDPEKAERKATDPDPAEKGAESCPIATRRLIREAMQQLRNFTEEHRLTATVAKALLAILAEIAVSALQGRVNTQVLEVIKRVIRHEQERLFDTHNEDGCLETPDTKPREIADDGLPHMINTPFASRQSFFELADQARL